MRLHCGKSQGWDSTRTAITCIMRASSFAEKGSRFSRGLSWLNHLHRRPDIQSSSSSSSPAELLDEAVQARCSPPAEPRKQDSRLLASEVQSLG